MLVFYKSVHQHYSLITVISVIIICNNHMVIRIIIFINLDTRNMMNKCCLLLSCPHSVYWEKRFDWGGVIDLVLSYSNVIWKPRNRMRWRSWRGKWWSRRWWWCWHHCWVLLSQGILPFCVVISIFPPNPQLFPNQLRYPHCNTQLVYQNTYFCEIHLSKTVKHLVQVKGG